MVDSSAACARGRAGPCWATENGPKPARSQCQPLASPMTPIQRRYPRVIRVHGVVESNHLVDQPPLGSPAAELVPVGELQLAQHRAHVRLDRLRADPEPQRDLLVQIAARN